MSFIRPIQSEVSYDLNEQELLQEIQTRIETESEGLLDDFDPASPLSAITEAQAYAIALVANDLNTLPDQFLFQFLQTIGVNKSTSKASRVVVTFTKTTGFSNTLVIPQGFLMFTGDGIEFTLDEQLVIPQGVPSAAGFATSSTQGASTNVPAGSITGFSLAIVGLGSINNFQDASGGTDEETDDQAKTRALSFLQFRQLVRPRDYETAARAIIGENYVVKALSYFEVVNYLYAGDDVDLERVGGLTDPISDLSRRYIYLVTSNQEGIGINKATQNQVLNYLYPRITSGNEVRFLAPTVTDISITYTSLDSPGLSDASSCAAALVSNQSVLFQGIGNNISMSSIFGVGERFFRVSDATVSILDVAGNSIIDYSGRSNTVLAFNPASVFLIREVQVRGANGTVYTF